MDAAEISAAAAAIVPGITVENFFPEPATRDADRILSARLRSEIAHDQNDLITGARYSDEAEHAVLCIV